MKLVDVIRDVVLPEIERSGGATLAIPTTGNQPPYLVVADSFQPPTWVVGTISGGSVPYPAADAEWIMRPIVDPQWGIMPRFTPSPYTAIGFWVDGDHLHIDGVEFYTLRSMAMEAARLHDQQAIYNLQTGETEWLTVPAYT